MVCPASQECDSFTLPQDVVTEYLTDAELWVMCDSLRQLETLQHDITLSDIQELIMDVNYARQLLRDVLASPHDVSETVRLVVYK